MDYVYLGKIVTTHGIKGEVRILSDFYEKDKIFIEGRNLYVGNSHERLEMVTYRVHKGYDMVTFKGYDNINQVLKYKGLPVYFKRSEVELDENEYLLSDLIGFNIREDGKILGKVLDIVYNNSNILLDIDDRFYIPIKGDFIESVNLKENIIETKNAKDLMI